MILLHGLDGSSRWWTPTLRALAPHFRCYALEFVRFDRWRERARVELPRAGTFVAAWLAALELDRAHIIAHSMGGYAACQLAITQPELVDRLVLVAPAILGARLLLAPQVGRLGPFAWTVTPAFLPILVGDSLRTGPLRWLRSAAELRRAELLPLEQIAAPTLLIWGMHYLLVPADDGPRVRERIAGSRLLTLPGARHVPMSAPPSVMGRSSASWRARRLAPVEQRRPWERWGLADDRRSPLLLSRGRCGASR